MKKIYKRVSSYRFTCKHTL